MIVIIVVLVFIGLSGAGLAIMFSGGRDERSAPVARPAPPPPVPPAPPPAPAPIAAPPAAPAPVPTPPREPTVNDTIRAHFKQAGGRLCVAGNLSRFGPFMGKVRLTCHPGGRVSGLRAEMQPSTPQVLKCIRQKFATGLAFKGGAREVVYHFNGGRSPDGLQYRDGIEFKGGGEDGATPAAPGASAAERGPQEKEGTVLKVVKNRGTRTVFTSRGARRMKLPPTYAVKVGLADGTRFQFLHLKNRLEKGSKVLVRYVADGGRKTKPELPVGDPGSGGRISARVLPRITPTPVGDATYSITFPAPAEKQKTDLGTLYRYQYAFSKSYYPDTYYFFRISAEGNASLKFFKGQASSLLALVGARELALRLRAPHRDRKTGLKKVNGRFSLRVSHTPRDGLIHLWYDARKKLLYGAWVLAYSSNRLASEREMKQAFFGSFALK